MNSSPWPEGPPSNEEMDEFLNSMPPRYTRKLTFSEQCGLAYALANKLKHAIVAKAFGLSRATVSHLANCLERNGRHYPQVRAEYQALGAEAFKLKYYAPLHWRLKRTKLDLNHLPGGEDDIARPAGSDPRAAKYAGPITLDDGTRWEIVWRSEPLGWAIHNLDLPDIWHGAEWIPGNEDFEPFRTSSAAYDAVHYCNGYESPRPKPGRHR